MSRRPLPRRSRPRRPLARRPRKASGDRTVWYVLLGAAVVVAVLWGLYSSAQAKEGKRARAREALEDYRETRDRILGD